LAIATPVVEVPADVGLRKSQNAVQINTKSDGHFVVLAMSRNQKEQGNSRQENGFQQSVVLEWQ
jgi:hypothetical protein